MEEFVALKCPKRIVDSVVARNKDKDKVYRVLKLAKVFSVVQSI